ncbi:unnamed protein product [Cylindrotheca closterium]|uniref:HSF-type DNA-binding domain-containing protein n=1 Tax=Cylindrotheca closterium TaxID=2856 RepID=A0AAD2CT96_9STRA|nr:unnamed protein product [Cylindrotheca closterium]
MTSQSSTPRKRTIRGGSAAQFPGKLHDMLCYVEKQGLHSIISWNFDGRSFMIHDPEKLMTILPIFFEQTKYRSFRRQLNMWHFERILDGPNRDSFHHPFFLRGNKELCAYMSRDAKSLPAGTPLRKLSCVEQGMSVLQTSQPLQRMLNTIYQTRANNVVDEMRRGGVNSRASSSSPQGLALSETGNSQVCDQASFAGRSFFPLEITPKQPTLKSCVPSSQSLLAVNQNTKFQSGSLERDLDSIMSMEYQKNNIPAGILELIENDKV